MSFAFLHSQIQVTTFFLSFFIYRRTCYAVSAYCRSENDKLRKSRRPGYYAFPDACFFHAFLRLYAASSALRAARPSATIRVFSSTVSACGGHACTHSGSCPRRRRPAQPLHFSARLPTCRTASKGQVFSQRRQRRRGIPL